MMDDQFASVQPVVRQWPLISPFFLQQQLSSRHGSYYNYRDPPPFCYWMEQTGHPTPPVQKITRIDRFQPYNPDAYIRSAQQNTLGIPYQATICQNVPNGRSGVYLPPQHSECSNPTGNNQQSPDKDTGVESGDRFGSAYNSLEHRNFDSAVESIKIWNAKENAKQPLQETVELIRMPTVSAPISTAAAGNYSIESLLKAASHARDSEDVATFACGRDGLREGYNEAACGQVVYARNAHGNIGS